MICSCRTTRAFGSPENLQSGDEGKPNAVKEKLSAFGIATDPDQAARDSMEGRTEARDYGDALAED